MTALAGWWYRRQERTARRLADPRPVRRPLPDGGEFDLHWVATGPAATPGPPVFIFPGGPGMASLLPYRRLRQQAARHGLRLIMMEHRGIGLSRRDLAGRDLPRAAMSVNAVVDDAAAVLDAAGIEQAVIYGTSYGSYLAQAFGVRHPGRVRGMILDSAMLSTDDDHIARQYLRELFWTGTPVTQASADQVRSLATAGVIDRDTAGFALQFLYEFGGEAVVARMLAMLAQGGGRRTWRLISRLGAHEVDRPHPFIAEFDLAGEIAFRELNCALPPDGLPFSVDAFTALAPRFSPFAGEPHDLRAALPSFTWPLVVLAGERDLRTPAVAATSIARLAPDAQLITIADHGHSALDTQPALAVQVMRAVVTGLERDGTLPRPLLQPAPTVRPPLIGQLVHLHLGVARRLPAGLS